MFKFYHKFVTFLLKLTKKLQTCGKIVIIVTVITIFDSLLKE